MLSKLMIALSGEYDEYDSPVYRFDEWIKIQKNVNRYLI